MTDKRLHAEQQQRLRAFLTQSAHSTGFGGTSRATTAAVGSARLRPATADLLSVEEMESNSCLAADSAQASPPPPWTTWRAATADESRARMALARRERLGESERLARMERASGELRAYSRGRFQEELQRQVAASWSFTERTSTDRQQGGSSRLASIKSSLSPYLTLPPPESLAIDPEEAFAQLDRCSRCRAGDVASDEWSAGRLRAQLMSQVRLRQPRQTVRFRHDRTAQELSQEGHLPSREVCELFPWQPDYQYSPFPEPKLVAWTEAERARRQDRVRMSEEFETEADKPDSSKEEPPIDHSPPAVSPPLVPVPLIELTKTLEVDSARPPTDHTPDGSTSALSTLGVQQQTKTVGAGQHGRPRSGRGKQLKPTKQQTQQQLLLQQQQQLLQQQLQQERLAAERRRNFSVSTIGEEELGRSHEQQQRLADICQRLRDRQAAREAAAAELRAVEEAARLALEAPPPPPPPPQPLPPPTPPPPQESQKKRPTKATGKSAAKKSPRPTSGGKKQQRSASAGSGGSSGSGGQKVKTPDQKQQQQKQPSDKPSPRAKSLKGSGATSKKRGAPAIKKKGKSSPPTQPPPQPQSEPLPPPPQQSEPAPPDSLDNLADEIETASVFHRTKQLGELPDLPCPSSEAKSRQRLTKIWWQRQQNSVAAPPSIIA